MALIVGLAGEAWCAHETGRLVERERQQAASLLGQLRATLESELNANLYLTNGLIAYVVSHSTLEAAAINPMLQVLFEQGNNVRNIGVAPGNRLTYVYPRAGNEAAIGLYYPDLPEQWPAIRQMIASGKPMLAGPVKLRQGGVGLIYRVPVFEQPGQRYWGLVSMVVNSDALFAKAGVAPRIGSMALAIRGRDGSGDSGPVFLGEAGLFQDPAAVLASVNTPGGTWQMAARHLGDSTDGAHLDLVRWAVWGVGLLLGASVFAALHGIRRRLGAEGALRHSEARLQAQNLHLREVVQRLDEAYAELKAANASRTQWLAAACHDLRQPAHALGLLADLAAEHTPPQARQPIEGIRRCSATLSDMLDMLLDMAQLESGRYRPAPATFALDDLLEELQLQFAPAAEAKSLGFVVKGGGTWVHSDRHLLRRMLMNLVSNAVKYTVQGWVQVTALCEAGQLVVTVEDTGPGIPPDQLALLQAGPPRSGSADPAEGLGLGLGIVQRGAALLDLPLDVQCAAGQGTCVRLTLPLSNAMAAGADAPAPLRSGGGVIGVLDNDENIVAAAEHLLQHHGYQVLTGHTPAELDAALARIGRAAPDLLLSDLHLGLALDGLQFIEQCQAREAWRETYFVLVTGDLDPHVAARAAALGVVLAYKPLQPRRLLQLVAQGLPADTPGRARPEAPTDLQQR